MRAGLAGLLGVLSILSIGTASADGLDTLINAEMRRQHIPGVSIAVVKNGKIIREQGYGLANVEHQVRVTQATIFQSGPSASNSRLRW